MSALGASGWASGSLPTVGGAGDVVVRVDREHDSHDASDDWTRCLKISLFPNKSLLTLHIIRNEKTDKNGHFIKFFVQPVILLISN